ncbi:MAG: glycosyltransferase family 39 protein [Thermoflexales bacterium]|nr:glycosyltransferase family 39 protein [Thermoflexales bacterium]MDW8352501.1 glycosyltransferase family 39 protein [Anaerolineae bacterium]
MPRTQPTRLQWLIVLAHIALALLYGAVNPPWEAHDETGHFAYVNHLVEERSLPDAYAEDKVLFDQSHQPPLYYLVAAALTFWANRSDGVQPEFNNFALDGTNRRGFRIMLRQPEEAFPWQGTILALHAARVVSALLTGLTVYLVASSANLIFGVGSTAALLSTAIAAFNPQVIFMGSMVNNDAMVTAMGAWVIYRVAHIAHGAAPTSPDAQNAARNVDFILLGLALGLAFLSKNNALGLIGFAGLALIFIARRAGWPTRELLGRGAFTLGAFAALALPYLGYNLARYGRLLTDRNPNNPILAAPTSVIGEGVWVSIRDAWLPQLFANTFRTFWGKFGWGNVGLPEWAYLAFAAFTLAGTIGCVIGYRRAGHALRTAILVWLMLGLSMMLLPLYRALFYQDPALMPGRYLMPALTAYASLLGFGWSVLIERWTAAAHKLTFALAAGLAAFALVVPFAFIWPRYQPGLIASGDNTALLTFGDLVQLVDATARTDFLPDREGMRHYARVKLTWRALRATDQHHAFSVSVLGRDHEVLGSIVVFPNLGNYPSTNWRAGDTFVDAYDILLEKPCARLPALGKLHVTVFPFEPLTTSRPISVTRVLPAMDGAGRVIAPIVGRFKIGEAPPFPVFWQPPLAYFDGIWLRDAQLPAQVRPGETVHIHLTYEMIHPTDRRGTAFLHLLDADGRLVAQDDHAPLNGEYPTDLWDAGECVRESFRLTIPPDARGTLRVATGFYAADGSRFETGAPDDVAFIGEIQIEAAASP